MLISELQVSDGDFLFQVERKTRRLVPLCTAMCDVQMCTMCTVCMLASPSKMLHCAKNWSRDDNPVLKGKCYKLGYVINL